MSIINNLLDKYESQAFENRYSRSTSLLDEDLIANRNSITTFGTITDFPEAIVVPLKDTDVIIHVEDAGSDGSKLATFAIKLMTPNLSFEETLTISDLSTIASAMNTLSKVSLNEFLADGLDSTPNTVYRVAKNVYYKNSKNTWEKDIKKAKIKDPDTYFPYFW